MIRGFIICILFFGGIILSSMHAQQKNDVHKTIKLEHKAGVDSSVVRGAPTVAFDSIVKIKPEFKPNATKAVLYSALLPGLGQIYNRKYWKLPILYGGFVGLAYAISWNGGLYNGYTQAYYDLKTGNGDSWHNFVPPNQTPESVDQEALAASLKRRKEYFRRNRDLSIICTVGLYALSMIDAYVDAHLYDFDISPDLSMRVQPVMWVPTQYSKTGVGIQCNINF